MIQPGRRAINRFTATELLHYRWIEGAYDSQNLWVDGGHLTALKVLGTPIPAGDKTSQTMGEQLEATPVGERAPAFMRFTTRKPFELNDVVAVYGIFYKIVRKGDYTDAGHATSMGTRLIDYTPNIVEMVP